ncbi:hypothetical protein N7512_000689 [Penicillium capsulatum]|nr:hypothetical protein N7512_000689 [Penicillium capsulatum]
MPVEALVHLGQNWLGATDIAVQSILLAIAFVVVGLRLWSRRLQRISLQWNDWLVVGATVIMLGRYIVELIAILFCGLGLDSSGVNHSEESTSLIRFHKLAYAGALLRITVVALVQLSILHFYLRRFLQQMIWRGAYILMGLCSALWIATFFATAFICSPPETVWLFKANGHCGDRNMLHTGCAASEVILNGFILLLSIPAVWHMRLPRARKIALAVIYILGVLIITISAVRIKIGSDIDLSGLTHDTACNSLLSCIIPLVGIVVACLPTLAPVVQKIFRTSMLSSTAGPSSHPVSPGYWKTTVLSGAQMEEPEIPLVTVTQPRIAKKLSELAHGQIQITSDWEIHSTRNSARLERDSIRRG